MRVLYRLEWHSNKELFTSIAFTEEDIVEIKRNGEMEEWVTLSRNSGFSLSFNSAVKRSGDSKRRKSRHVIEGELQAGIPSCPTSGFQFCLRATKVVTR